MNIIILNGSPRVTSNTKALLEQISNGINTSNLHQVETINVANKKLTGCIACNTCMTNGHTCVLPDGSAEIINKLTEADLIIFGSPVYWCGISAQLKIIIDKFYSNQDGLKNKKFGIVAVGAEEVADEQYKCISDQFKCIAKFLNCQIIFDEKASAWEPGEVTKDQALLDKFYTIGKNII